MGAKICDLKGIYILFDLNSMNSSLSFGRWPSRFKKI